MHISEQIKAKRQKLSLTQKEFADALGLDKDGDRTLKLWENGEKRPSQSVLETIMTFPEVPSFPNIDSGKEKIRFIDLFAGIGGIRLPFQELGGRCVFTSEFDRFAQKTYMANFGEIPSGDITKINSKDIPDHDLLLAGFPCQPFSQAGLGLGFSDTRGTLFFDIERILNCRRPAAYLLENVKRLRGHDGGNTYRLIVKHLLDAGYTVDSKILKASDFGVPQNRERIFIVGFRKDLITDSHFTFQFPTPSKAETSVGDILEHNVNEKYTISDRLYAGHLRRRREHAAKGNGFGFSVFNASSPYTNTISARYYKDGSEILIEQAAGNNPRKLTPRECARLQGFPENFIIPVSDTQAYKQFGNSVSVPVVNAIAGNIIKVLVTLGVAGT